jgi:hypothetical protein
MMECLNDPIYYDREITGIPVGTREKKTHWFLTWYDEENCNPHSIVRITTILLNMSNVKSFVFQIEEDSDGEYYVVMAISLDSSSRRPINKFNNKFPGVHILYAEDIELVRKYCCKSFPRVTYTQPTFYNLSEDKYINKWEGCIIGKQKKKIIVINGKQEDGEKKIELGKIGQLSEELKKYEDLLDKEEQKREKKKRFDLEAIQLYKDRITRNKKEIRHLRKEVSLTIPPCSGCKVFIEEMKEDFEERLEGYNIELNDMKQQMRSLEEKYRNILHLHPFKNEDLLLQ